VAKADVIGSDEMKLVGKRRDEVAEHLAAGWKPMQQYDGG
jgi:hypothetical protein